MQQPIGRNHPAIYLFHACTISTLQINAKGKKKKKINIHQHSKLCLYLKAEEQLQKWQSSRAEMQNGSGVDISPVPRTCWIKHLSHAQGNGAERARVCRHEAPYPSLGPREFSLDAFYTSPKKNPHWRVICDLWRERQRLRRKSISAFAFCLEYQQSKQTGLNNTIYTTYQLH